MYVTMSQCDVVREPKLWNKRQLYSTWCKQNYLHKYYGQIHNLKKTRNVIKNIFKNNDIKTNVKESDFLKKRTYQPYCKPKDKALYILSPYQTNNTKTGSTND